MLKIIVLDRDGVINQDSDKFVKSPEEWIPIPGSIEAIAQLYQAGFTIIVISNQSGIGRGYFDLNTLHKMHEKMLHLVHQAGGKIDKIYFCPHTPDDYCQCRKPEIGLFEQLAKDYQVDLKKIICIGDAERDLIAAQKIGAFFILVRTGKGELTLKKNLDFKSIQICDDLADAADFIIENNKIP